MSTQTVVTDPPQPQGQGQYPLTALRPSNITEYQNNADYSAKTGKVAPVYNPAAPVKRWADSSVQPGTFSILTYNTAHLDPSFQKPIVTTINVPSFMAGTVNMPPDSGPIPPSTAGEMLVPIRALLPNEKLVANPFGISVVNTDVLPDAPVAAGGGFTDADRATANATLNKVNALCAFLNVPQ